MTTRKMHFSPNWCFGGTGSQPVWGYRLLACTTGETPVLQTGMPVLQTGETPVLLTGETPVLPQTGEAPVLHQNLEM